MLRVELRPQLPQLVGVVLVQPLDLLPPCFVSFLKPRLEVPIVLPRLVDVRLQNLQALRVLLRGRVVALVALGKRRRMRRRMRPGAGLVRREKFLMSLLRVVVLLMKILHGGLHILAEVLNLGLENASGPVLVIAIDLRVLMIFLGSNQSVFAGGFLGSTLRMRMDIRHDLVVEFVPCLIIPMIVHVVSNMLSDLFGKHVLGRELKSVWTGRVEGWLGRRSLMQGRPGHFDRWIRLPCRHAQAVRRGDRRKLPRGSSAPSMQWWHTNWFRST